MPKRRTLRMGYLQKTRLRFGFSLIEILVAIVILSVLSILISGMTQRSIVSSRTAASMGNLREIWSALNYYRADHNDYYPAIKSYYLKENGVQEETAWTRYPIDPYLPMRTVSRASLAFNCPNAKYVKQGGGYYEIEELTRTYATTSVMVGLHPNGDRANDEWLPRLAGAIERPADTILLHDAGQLPSGDPWCEAATWWLRVEPQISGQSVGFKRIDYRQNGKALFMYVDGHVIAMSPKEVKEVVSKSVWDGIW